MATKRKTSGSSAKQTADAELLARLAKLEEENARLRATSSDNFNIGLTEYIEVMSLIPYRLNLSTEENGRGSRFKFSSFGEVKRILYNDLAKIFENYKSFMEKGFFYILDERVIRKHGLDDMYDKILSKDKIEQVLDCNPKTAVKLYESANEAQREIMDTMLVSKLKENEDAMDLNIISAISKIGEKDLVSIAKESLAMEAVPANA